MLIGIDVDFTIVDTLNPFLEYLWFYLEDTPYFNKDFNVFKTKLFNSVKVGSFTDILNFLESYDLKFMDKIKWFWNNISYSKLKPMPEAKKTIDLLHKDGNKVVFITRSPNGSVESKMKFLEKYFPYAYDIIITSKKFLINLDVFIDDAFEWVETWQQHHPSGKAYLFKTPLTERQNKLKVWSWKELEKELLNLKRGVA